MQTPRIIVAQNRCNNSATETEQPKTSLSSSDSDTLIPQNSSVDTVIQQDSSNQQAWNPAPVANFTSSYLGHFQHVSCLGRGGFSVVFVARNKMNDKEYAVKRIGVRNTTGAMDRITREVRALAHLEHPNIVRYYTAWIETPPPGWQKQQDDNEPHRTATP